MWKFSPEKLRERRTKLNMSIRELEKKSGLHRGYISNIENKKRVPGADNIATFSNVLHVTPSFFFERDDEKE